MDGPSTLVTHPLPADVLINSHRSMTLSLWFICDGVILLSFLQVRKSYTGISPSTLVPTPITLQHVIDKQSRGT